MNAWHRSHVFDKGELNKEVKLMINKSISRPNGFCIKAKVTINVSNRLAPHSERLSVYKSVDIWLTVGVQGVTASKASRRQGVTVYVAIWRRIYSSNSVASNVDKQFFWKPISKSGEKKYWQTTIKNRDNSIALFSSWTKIKVSYLAIIRESCVLNVRESSEI